MQYDTVIYYSFWCFAETVAVYQTSSPASKATYPTQLLFQQTKTVIYGSGFDLTLDRFVFRYHLSSDTHL